MFSYHHLRHLARPMARHPPLKLSATPVEASLGSERQTPSMPLHHTHPRAPGSGDHRALIHSQHSCKLFLKLMVGLIHFEVIGLL